jgi:protein phosphatase
MGGHAAGEVASALTVESIAAAIDTTHAGAPSAGPAVHRARLLEAFAYASTVVFSRGLTNKTCEGMGSTAIAGLISGETLHLCHVGDARGYHLSKGKFRRVTNDHSLVWQLVMSGLLNPEQARLHPHRGRVTQAIGMENVRPEVITLMLKPADRVLLCSDGLWEALPEPEIGEIVASSGSMLELASILVDRANAESGKDNITAILYEHGVRP